MANNTETTRFTATLPIDYIEELKEMIKIYKIRFLRLVEAILIYSKYLLKNALDFNIRIRCIFFVFVNNTTGGRYYGKI